MQGSVLTLTTSLVLLGLAAAPCAAQTPDTAGRRADSAAGVRVTPPAPPAPADTTLGTACGAAGRGVAAGLLVVTFDPRTTAAERSAVGKSVGGALIPRPGAADGEYYLRLSAAGSDQEIQRIADELILRQEVRSIGSIRCPAPPPQPSPVPASPTPSLTPADSAPRPSSATPDSARRDTTR